MLWLFSFVLSDLLYEIVCFMCNQNLNKLSTQSSGTQ